MRKKSFLYKVLFLMLLVLGIGSQTIADAPSSDYDNPKYTGDIVGHFITCGSSEGIRVYIPGSSFDAITSAVGNFKISYVQPGTYNLTIIQDGQNIGSIPNVTVIAKQVSDVGTVTLCLDNDGDGYAQDVDCNDSNPLINPGADEICNNKDDNCDGEIDNNAPDAPIWFVDEDGDGYGTINNFIKACEMPPIGFSENYDDCNDNNASINPGVVEVCGDSIDNNCNGQTDEGCP